MFILHSELYLSTYCPERALQQTGPEVNMVQSVTRIWEEELLRTGQGGPAGPVNVHYHRTTLN